MKLTATLKTDAEDRLYCALTENSTGLPVHFITDTVAEIVRPFREDVKEWAAEAGHEITAWKMEGVNL